MEIAIISVENTKLKIKQNAPVTVGMTGCSVIFECFSPEWLGLSKTAVFRMGLESRDVVNVQEGEPVTIPWEVLTRACSNLMVGICGTNSNGTIVIPTIWGHLGEILPGANPVGRPALPPTPDWTHQIENQVNDALREVNTVRPMAVTAQMAADQAAVSERTAKVSSDNAKRYADSAGQASCRASESSKAAASSAGNADSSARIASEKSTEAVNAQKEAVRVCNLVKQEAEDAHNSAARSESHAQSAVMAKNDAAAQAERAQEFADRLENTAAVSTSLGVNGAGIGDIFRARQVDTQGRVTQWMPEPGYELIYEEEVLKPVAQIDKQFSEKYTAMRIGVRCSQASDKKETLYITAGTMTLKGVATPYNKMSRWDSMMKIILDHGIWNVTGMHGADSYGKTEVVGPVGCATPVQAGHGSFQIPYLNRIFIYVLGGNTIDLHTKIQVWGRK